MHKGKDHGKAVTRKAKKCSGAGLMLLTSPLTLTNGASLFGRAFKPLMVCT